MAYLYSLASRVTNNVMAPLKVAIDKTYDVVINLENKNGENKDKSTINVDGIDSVIAPKKMERLYPGANFFTLYTYFFSLPTQVYNGIYLGSAFNASCWYTLESLNIKYIVNVTSEITNYYESSSEMTYYRIPIKDDNNESIQGYFDESFKKIDEFLSKNDGNILVHCYMGSSRSATIVANFMSKKGELDITDVLENLTSRRPIVNPTQQFVKDLITEKSI